MKSLKDTDQFTNNCWTGFTEKGYSWKLSIWVWSVMGVAVCACELYLWCLSYHFTPSFPFF